MSIPVGGTIYLRLTDLDDAGNDDGLAFDDVSINFAAVTGVPEPSTYAYVLGGLGALVALRFRRRRN